MKQVLALTGTPTRSATIWRTLDSLRRSRTPRLGWPPCQSATRGADREAPVVPLSPRRPTEANRGNWTTHAGNRRTWIPNCAAFSGGFPPGQATAHAVAPGGKQRRDEREPRREIWVPAVAGSNRGLSAVIRADFRDRVLSVEQGSDLALCRAAGRWVGLADRHIWEQSQARRSRRRLGGKGWLPAVASGGPNVPGCGAGGAGCHEGPSFV